LPARAAPDRITTIGLAQLLGMAYRGQDLTPVWDRLTARGGRDPQDAAAWMDMATILLLLGERERGLHVQEAAIALSPLYRRPHGAADGLKVLALVAPGDFMANAPLDLLLEGSAIELHLLYCHPLRPLPAELPEHDVCALAIGESPENRPLLAQLQDRLAAWPCPVINGPPERIAALTRDGVCAMFAGDARIVVPKTIRCSRSALAAGLSGLDFPIIARPVHSHAGIGLFRLEGADDLAAYLRERPEHEFYVAPFVDYRSPDGLFRKQRVAFVAGRPFISHMAISEHWMVHYLSAGMEESAAKRAEEGRFFHDFDTGFARRHERAFADLYARIGLDYFGIDCAELPDGRLLVFEVDVAMIVHSLDPEHLFPYKQPAMARLFRGFQAMLGAAAASRSAPARAPAARPAIPRTPRRCPTA